MSVEQAVKLRVHSGVPIVDVFGEWLPTVTDSVCALLRSLAESGHYDIVLNVQRAALTGMAPFAPLAQLAQSVRSHCGYIDVVGTREQVNELIRSSMEKAFRL